MCFDSDEAGQNAAVRSLDHLLASGLAVRVAVVPAPHDPDSFIKANGGEAFRKLIENAEGFFDYYLNRLCGQNDSNSDKGRNAILRDMAEAVHKTGNTVLIDKYAQKTALRLGVSPEAVRAEFQKSAVGSLPSPVQRAMILRRRNGNLPTRRHHTNFICSNCFCCTTIWLPWAALHLDVNWISHPLVRKIVTQRLAAQTNETWKSLGAFLDECELPEMQSLITEAVAEDRKIPNPEQQLADVVLKLRNQFLDRQIAVLTQKISQSGVPEAEQNECLRQQQELRVQKRAPLGP